MSGSSIIGWGSSLPDKIVTNFDLEKVLDTNNDWIVERTGIRERHIGGTTESLATQAATEAVKQAGIGLDEYGGLILATTTPDKTTPGTSAAVHKNIGISGFAFDINAACAGFIYSFVVGHQLVKALNKPIVIVGSDTLSTITDMTDRTTAILLADGAGALIIAPNDNNDCLLSFDLQVDGNLEDILYCNLGGYLKMNGKEVFKKAIRAAEKSALKVTEQAGFTMADISLLVPHQANQRIMDSLCERLSIPREKCASVIESTGNTSSASIPLALVDSIKKGSLQSGDLILMTGFGAGMTWGSALIKWS